MKIRCNCGAVIVDQTDFIPYKAHLIADQDWHDFADSAEKTGQIDASLVRQCYQCTACGRLYVDDADRVLHVFVPEAPGHAILGSRKGDAWPAPLIAHWMDQPSHGQAKGTVWCASANQIEQHHADWAAFEEAYYLLFTELKAAGLLRYAYLTRNRRDMHA